MEHTYLSPWSFHPDLGNSDNATVLFARNPVLLIKPSPELWITSNDLSHFFFFAPNSHQPLLFCLLLGTEPWSSCMLGKCSITELCL